jgi:DNA-binding NtrC family response regulator
MPNASDSQGVDLRQARILVVDDEVVVQELIVDMLRSEVGELACASTIADARALIRKKQFDIALLDVKLPDGSGGELIADLKRYQKNIAAILITGNATKETAFSLEAMGIGALLVKPFTRIELRCAILREYKRMSAGEAEQPLTANDSDCNLVGNSPYIRDLRKTIGQFGRSDLPVLIQGPTGTGKEIIARAIHAHSGRHDKPMMVVNSSAIPEHLEESEFFGHAKGAFTGANDKKDGILKCAHGTSLFLDEVGDLSLRMQAKLLRVLDGHEFYRIGETVTQKSDFRLISATNRPLQEMVKEGTFRQDLYFRLKAGLIQTRPLAEYRDDIPSLVKHFMAEYRRRSGKEIDITREALSELVDHEWPGNIRELRNAIESLCVISSDTGTISAEFIDWMISGVNASGKDDIVPFSEAKIEFERKYYHHLLGRFGGNISVAARAAGIERAYFSKRVRALGLNIEDFRQSELVS